MGRSSYPALEWKAHGSPSAQPGNRRPGVRRNEKLNGVGFALRCKTVSCPIALVVARTMASGRMEIGFIFALRSYITM